jgi:hypothetical protein
LQYLAQTNVKTTTVSMMKTKEKKPNPNKPDQSINFFTFPFRQKRCPGFKAVFQLQNISNNKTKRISEYYTIKLFQYQN